MVSQQNSIRVLIVDDEEIVRYGLKAIFRSLPEVEVIAEASNGREAIAKALELQPDIILMDIAMPVMDGVTATGKIARSLPYIKVLILTTHDRDRYLIEAIQQGAVGFLLKNTPPEDFLHIIHATHKGYMQFGPSLGKVLSQQLSQQSNCSPKKLSQLPKITPREQEVVQLIAEGASNREIATMLHITEKTVKNHVSSILSRVGVRDRTQLAIWANTSEVSHPETCHFVSV